MAGEEGEARLVKLGGRGCAVCQTKAHLLLRLSHKSRARSREQGAGSREQCKSRREP